MTSPATGNGARLPGPFCAVRLQDGQRDEAYAEMNRTGMITQIGRIQPTNGDRVTETVEV